MATSRKVRRLALCASVLTLGLTLPTTANGSPADTTSTATAITPSGRSGDPQSAVDHVADFYGTYIDALYDSGRGRLTDALRRHYLTADARHSLARWEAAHHKDGVLRANGVPARWTVVYNDSGMGHCWTRVTLTWKDPGHDTRHTHLMVQSDLATRLISGIRAGE
ncbi:hypothetical protein [Streptomyces sp. SYP-A7185]|uniref:hypothetical protein n=1 Tax=Streptomyces sp. SYP-A7185 TaxID=3040076 RepID=UPI0038F7B4A4